MLLLNRSRLTLECCVTTKLDPDDKAKITVPVDDRRVILEGIAKLGGWKTSEIYRDPVLGKDLYFYFTRYSVDYEYLLGAMDALGDALNLHGYPLVRQEIGLVVYDSREVMRAPGR